MIESRRANESKCEATDSNRGFLENVLTDVERAV